MKYHKICIIPERKIKCMDVRHFIYIRKWHSWRKFGLFKGNLLTVFTV